MRGVGQKWLERVRPFVKPVLIVFGIILLALLALLRANFSYVDDLGRAAVGYKGWGNFSRYLTNVLAAIFHGNSFLTDISPWGQIVAMLLMAIAGVMLLYIIYGRKKFRWWELLVVSMLALNPYFLQCLSYKFDAPFMAVAVLGMIMPFLMRGRLAKGDKWWLYGGSVLLGVLVTCMTYQAALGILPMITVVLAVRMWGQKDDWRQIGKFVGVTALGYGVGLLIFKLFIMRLVDDYVVTAVPGLAEIIPQTLGNLWQYYNYVLADFTKIWLGLIGLVVIGAGAALVLGAKRPKWLAALVAVLAMGVLGLVCFGIYVVMEKPLFEPRAMLGVGVLICLLAVLAVEERKLEQAGWRYLYGAGVAAAVVLAYLFGVFALTYGNALAVQKEYTDFRIAEVAMDLAEELRPGEVIETAGTIGHAPAIRSASQEYPILARLVPIELEAGYWGQYKMIRYYGLSAVEGNMFAQPAPEDFPIVKEGWYHNLRRQEGSNVVLVELLERE